MISRRHLVSLFFVASTVALYFFFPAENAMESFTALVVFLIVLPLLYIKIVLRETPADVLARPDASAKLKTFFTLVGTMIFIILAVILLTKTPLLTKEIVSPPALTVWQVVAVEVATLLPMFLLFGFFVYRLVAHILSFLPQKVLRWVLFFLFVVTSFPLGKILMPLAPLWVLFVPFVPVLVLRVKNIMPLWYAAPLAVFVTKIIVDIIMIISL